jgi:predicted ATPase/DNA-binding CsgD family transcriptional regulator
MTVAIAPTSFVGREREIADVTALLREARLVTVTGPGGAGKTRLAVEVARRAGEPWFASLAEVSVEGLPAAVAAALGEDPPPSVDDLPALIGHRRGVLILDNFEHLLAAAPAVARIAAAGARLRVLVTSRAVLRVAGERVYELPPLAFDDAQRLFCDRAEGAGATVDDREAVAAVCRLLDGLPLAIELAAARARLLPAPALLSRLADPLATLVGGARDAPARQRTMRATVEWSFALLDDEARAALARLGVLEGAFALEVGEALAGGLEPLQTLVDHNLVQTAPGAGGSARLRLHAAVRKLAREHLAAGPEEARTRRRHAELFLERGMRAAAEVGGADQVGWVDRLDAEHGDLRAALSFWLREGDAAAALRLTAALKWLWFMRGPLDEGRRLAAAALAVPGAESHRGEYAAALEAAGWLAQAQGDLAEGAQLARRAIAVQRAGDDPRGLAWALTTLGFALARGGDPSSAAPFAESVAIFRELGDRYGMSFGLSMQGLAALDDPRPVEESLALTRELGDAQGTARALLILGWMAMERDDRRAAAERFGEALELSAMLRHPYLTAYALEAAAELAERLGDHARCLRLAAGAGAMRERSRMVAGEPLRARVERAVERAAEVLPEPERDAARREGRELAETAILAEARRVVVTPLSPALVGTTTLTAREVEVLRLVAEGLTDAAVAGRLFVSVRTVNAHLRSIYTKLGVTSRAAATRIAVTEGVLETT